MNRITGFMAQRGMRAMGFVAAALAFMPAPQAHAEPKVGVDFEVLFPFSSETRRNFGSTLTGIGLGFGKVVPKPGGHFAPDVLVASHKKNGNKLAFYGAGVQYRRTFGSAIDETTRFVPYYGAGVGLAYGNVELPGQGIDDSKVVPAGSVFIGTSIGKRGILEARVRALPQVGGLSFSGLSLTAGVRF